MMRCKNTFQLRMIKDPHYSTISDSVDEGGALQTDAWVRTFPSPLTGCVTSICKMGSIYLKGRLCKVNGSVYA